MIEADNLIEKIDEIILENKGLCCNGRKFYGYIHLQFENGFRKPIYRRDDGIIEQTISKEKRNDR